MTFSDVAPAACSSFTIGADQGPIGGAVGPPYRLCSCPHLSDEARPSLLAASLGRRQRVLGTPADFMGILLREGCLQMDHEPSVNRFGDKQKTLA